ncbi:D-alanyl-D-alanine carboxypeptidase family protein [Arthrobacter sp. KK5.5]|uniref:D-alanyl-D-alanine carboxypeptidase family protein n=1 Tax=Arthrobacter sp. KK5.5 TaxID=3373084 RepID=UPI003EE65C9D
MLRNQRPAAVLAALSLAFAAALGAAPAAVAAPAVVPYSAATAPLAVPAAKKAAPRNPARADVLVNKSHPLVPRTYVPRLVTVKGVAGVPVKLQPGAAAAYAKMAAGARKGGVVLRATSSYRSYKTQATLMANYTRWYGAAYAKRVVAPAGTSEHQTGLAVDVSTAAGAGGWMARNAYRYGYILRYPPGRGAVTGYGYEPWHYRYVGTAIASSMRGSGTPTLEHHLGAVAQASAARAGTKTTTANLNLRAGAGTGHRILATVPKGKTVATTGKRSGSWHQVKYGARTGWMSGTYLR